MTTNPTVSKTIIDALTSARDELKGWMKAYECADIDTLDVIAKIDQALKEAGAAK